MKRLLFISLALIVLVSLLQVSSLGNSAQGSFSTAADQTLAPTPIIANPFDTLDWTGQADLPGNSYGAAVASAGDVNGDGYADVIVGAPNYANGQDREGRAYAYYGSADGLSTDPDWTFESDIAKCQLGWRVASAGDVNGDGYDDVFVSSEFCTTGDPATHREGRVYLFLGSASGLTATPGWVKDGGSFDESFGWSTASAGDVNGDGFGDVVIGAPWASYPEGHEGRAYIFYGSASGLPGTANLTFESNASWSDFGSWVDSAGDVNGDGFDDVVIGHSRLSNPELLEGRVYLYLGSSLGLITSPAWTFESNIVESLVGFSVAGVGDVNGDGYDDVMAGGSDYSQPLAGSAYLFLGSATGLSTTPDWSHQGTQAGAQYGWSIAPAGDVNDDGYADVIIGAPLYTVKLPMEGISFLYYGAPDADLSTTVFSQRSRQADALWGYSVSTAGDVNGDGLDDILIGSRDYDEGELNEGHAFVYYGMADLASRLLLPIVTR